MLLSQIWKSEVVPYAACEMLHVGELFLSSPAITATTLTSLLHLSVELIKMVHVGKSMAFSFLSLTQMEYTEL
ncbi:hypothetical protein GDO81_021007 [Engystomops pustulosus]|uniref:Uncharacterized protein n=1 Tax=Engystomops pustulosus TaxID=76066 RepID=A0AAV6YWM6_ENGPU|nr:hypothetical protein GDO81_021007 [Engystomops pustulosus]